LVTVSWWFFHVFSLIGILEQMLVIGTCDTEEQMLVIGTCDTEEQMLVIGTCDTGEQILLIGTCEKYPIPLIGTTVEDILVTVTQGV
jgi:hypothetical protein